MQQPLFAADGGPHRLGCVRVHFGDWRDVASQWPRDAVAIFDPPYGIRYVSGMKGRGWSGRTDKGDARELAAEIVGDENTRERDDVLARFRRSSSSGIGRLRWRSSEARIDE